MSSMETVVGLEIHVQLKTATKLFCSCPTGAPQNTPLAPEVDDDENIFGFTQDDDAGPNSRICEICTGQPGALPRLNAKAVELAAKAGLALDCHINPSSIFARKNYFYPDLPAGFQTSQLDPPICEGGGMELSETGKYIRLNRIHLEDDAGKCVHDPDRGLTLVDLNRAGTPLIEIVTEPDFRSGAEVVEFLKKLHAILVKLEVTAGRMQAGEFRCDVNISLRPTGSNIFGVRAEIKNLNSFRHVAQAIEYEIVRQQGLYDKGEPVLQQTRLFDPAKQETRALRSKEEALDYRYFPQPDLPPVLVNDQMLASLKEEMPEMPEESIGRLCGLGLSEEHAAVIVGRHKALEFFDATVRLFNDPKRIGTLVVELLLPNCQKEDISPANSKVGPESMATLARLMSDNTLSRRAAYDLFPELFINGGDPAQLAKEKGLTQISDASSLTAVATEIINEFPAEAQKFRDGQDKVLSFFVGQLMRRTKGAANPKVAGEVLSKILKS